ncbi:MAG: xanthine dehydrogenase family protein subunit M [Rubrivivax sp.]|nr:xanthine dehydrogenase family protein subunit M [Rubrivivax sp.]
MRPFDFSAPASLDEAVALLRRFGSSASLFAGGTDLLVEIKEQIRQPGHVIDLKRIPGLETLAFDAARGLEIGALVKVRDLETSALVQRHHRGLWQAARELGSIQVRNRATLAGNVCRASPSADTLPPLVTDGATVHVHGPQGARAVAAEAFFTAPGRTVLAPDEIVTRFTLPAPAANTGRAYLKHGRRKAMELATVGVAVSLAMRGDGAVHDVRIVLGAVAPTPLRARAAESLLEGRVPDATRLDEAAAAAAAESRPISDVRASAAYRRRMVGVLVKRAVLQALENIR